MSKTYMAKKETAEPNWFVVDVDNMIVGRIATRLATVLMGKHKPTYTPHVDSGDYIIVLNADRVRFSGSEPLHAAQRAHRGGRHSPRTARAVALPDGRCTRRSGVADR